MKIPERTVSVGNVHFYVNHDDEEYHLREMYEMNVYKVSVRSGTSILDIGANTGMFAVWAAKQGATIWSYEPNPGIFKELQRNLAINCLTNNEVKAHWQGVWSRGGYMNFFLNEATPGQSTFLPEIAASFNPQNISVPVIAFDDVLGEKQWDIVKLDIEGAELEILSSSKKLSQIQTLAFEWHPYEPRDDFEARFEKMLSKLRRYFDVPQVDYNWHILTMNRRTGLPKSIFSGE